MKCPYCGAEVNTSIMKCEYCGSKFEPKVKRSPKRKAADSSKHRSVIIIVLVIFVVAMIVGTLVIPLTGALFVFSSLSSYESSQSTTTDISDEEERLVDKLPKNAVDIVGEIVSCTTSGTADIKYADKYYSDIQILDMDLIEWLTDRGSSIDNIGIMFSTDEDRNISEIALLSNPFYVMYQEGDTYVAFREDHVIAFTSEIDLMVDRCYEGYFNYPNMKLHSGTTTDCGSYAFYYRVCDEKVSTTEASVPEGREVTVYKVRVGSDWYYCSKDTYDKLNIGDELDEYTFVGRGYNYIY